MHPAQSVVPLHDAVLHAADHGSYVHPCWRGRPRFRSFSLRRRSTLLKRAACSPRLLRRSRGRSNFLPAADREGGRRPLPRSRWRVQGRLGNRPGLVQLPLAQAAARAVGNRARVFLGPDAVVCSLGLQPKLRFDSLLGVAWPCGTCCPGASHGHSRVNAAWGREENGGRDSPFGPWNRNSYALLSCTAAGRTMVPAATTWQACNWVGQEMGGFAPEEDAAFLFWAGVSSSESCRRSAGGGMGVG